jgi:hypothetical protein
MIHHYQKGEILKKVLETPQRRQQKQFTVKFDTELINQVDFLATHLEIKKIEVLRQLVKAKIQSLGLWDTYQDTEKRYQETELIQKN